MDTATGRLCGTCGDALGEGDRFCPTCGAPTEGNTFAAEKPPVTDGSSVDQPVAPVIERRVHPRVGRRRWLLALSLASALIVALAVAVAIVGISSSDDEPPQLPITEEPATGQAAARSYVEKIDRLLTGSARTRSSLGGLINDVQQREIGEPEARARIAAIIDQRQNLQDAVASLETPPAFRHAADLLRASIRAALADDFAIQGWISAEYERDARSVDRFYTEHKQRDTRATAAKRAFVEEYDRVRDRTLNLGPSPAGDRY